MTIPQLISLMALLALLAVSTVKAQDQPGVLKVMPKWRAGETIAFDTVKTRSDVVNEQVVQSITIRWSNTLEVIEVNDQEVVVAWTRDEVEFDMPTPVPAAVKVMIDLWRDIRIEFVLDAVSHENLGIRNHDEVLKALDQTLVQVRQLFLKSTPEAQADRIIDMTRQTFADPDIGSALLIKDMAGIIGAFGREINLKGITRYESELPNPFGGPPIPVIETWNEPKLIGTTKPYVLDWSQDINLEAFGHAAAEFAKKIAPDQAPATEQIISAMKRGAIETKGQYHYDADVGKITYAKLMREVADDEGRERIETWEWTLTPIAVPNGAPDDSGSSR